LQLLSSKPGLLIVDYLQKFIPVDTRDPRLGVNMVMDGLRELASAGWAVIAISATNRPTKDSQRLTVNSLRESSEIEFQADSIYLLHDEGPARPDQPWIHNVKLEHVKNRHDKTTDLELEFDQPRMEFTQRKTNVLSSPFAVDFAQHSRNPFEPKESF